MSVWWLGTVLETVKCSLTVLGPLVSSFIGYFHLGICICTVMSFFPSLLVLMIGLISIHSFHTMYLLSPAVPPNITMQPVAVTPNETTTQCCAGIRVFLEDPTDPTIVFTAQVSTDGTPFTDRSVTRERDVVYVEGLQAGTPYNVRLTAWNQFGSTIKDVLATPLIGETVHCVCTRC